MTDAAAPPSATPQGSCPRCGADGLEPGVLLETNDLGNVDVLWAVGSSEQSWWAPLRVQGRPRRVVAMRCVGCSRIELFAGEDVLPR